MVHPILHELFDEMPEPGENWPLEQRFMWLKAAEAIFDLIHCKPPVDADRHLAIKIVDVEYPEGTASELAVRDLHGILADAWLMARYETYTAAALVEVVRTYFYEQGFHGPYIDGPSLATGNDQTTLPVQPDGGVAKNE
jgi:hypothetical protein